MMLNLERIVLLFTDYSGLLYFICALEPISDEINLQEDEIADCQWMPVYRWIVFILGG